VAPATSRIAAVFFLAGERGRRLRAQQIWGACDRERIQIPGAILPYGAMLVLARNRLRDGQGQ